MTKIVMMVMVCLFWSISASADEKNKWQYQEASDSFNASVASNNTASGLMFTCTKGVDRCVVLMHIPSIQCQGSIHSLATTEKNSMQAPMYCHTKSGFWVLDFKTNDLMGFVAIVNTGKNLTITIPSGSASPTEIGFTLKGAGAAIAAVVSSNANLMNK